MNLYLNEFLTTFVIAGNFQKASKEIVSNFPCWLF